MKGAFQTTLYSIYLGYANIVMFKLRPMKPDTKERLKSILEVARYAPSVHNTQPWKVSYEGDLLKISIDPRHKLTTGDPTGRETIISLGIFAEAVCLAASEKGFSAKNARLDGKEAIIHLEPAKQTDPDAHRFSGLLMSRCTDRSVFQNVPLSKPDERSIRSVKPLGDTNIHVATDDKIIETTALLTSKAIRVALSHPHFRRELASYLTHPWSSKRRGISVLNLGIPAIIGIFEPIVMRLGWGMKTEGDIERRRWGSSSAIVFITAKGDMPRYWFNAGRTYLRVCLEIERLGLSQATSAAIVEASNYHDDIEELIGTKDRILAIIRVGKGTRKKHHSPRVDVDELLH